MQGALGIASFLAPAALQAFLHQKSYVTMPTLNVTTSAASRHNAYVRQQQQQQQNNFLSHMPSTSTTVEAASPMNLLDIPLTEECVHASQTMRSVPIEAQPSRAVVDTETDKPEKECEIDIQIRNVVCNYTLPLHIDLHRVALHSSNVTFDRGRGVLLKQKRNPSCYVKVYSSGKIYIVGCKSESECKRAARGVGRMVQKQMGRTGEAVRIRNYRVCNVLATCKMPFGIKIEELAQKYSHRSQYEPELSVGLVWRSVDPKATLRIHTTGSVTVTGAVSEDDVMRAIKQIYPIVNEFRSAQRFKGIANTKRKATRKRKANGGPSSKRVVKSIHSNCNRGSSVCTERSSVFGNLVYFSDEDDEFND